MKPFCLLLSLVIFLGSSMAIASTSIKIPGMRPVLSGSPEQYYNEALTAEQQGDLIGASLALRRAVVLNPTLTVAQDKLQEVLKKMGLPVEKTWQTELASHVSPELLMLVGSLIGWGAAFVVIWIFFTRYLSMAERSKKKPHWPLALALLFFFLGHAVACVGIMIDPRMTCRHTAVMLSKNAHPENAETKLELTPLRATPVDNAATIAQLPAGMLITLLSRHGVWSYVRVGSGQEGWVASSSVTALIPRK